MQPEVVGTEGWAPVAPVPQVSSIVVAAPPGQVTDSVPAVLSMLIVPTSAPEPFLMAMVIGPLVPDKLTPLTSIE